LPTIAYFNDRKKNNGEWKGRKRGKRNKEGEIKAVER